MSRIGSHVLGKIEGLKNIHHNPLENNMRIGTNNYKSPPASITISESDLEDKRDDLFYEITTTGSAAGYSLHDLIENLDDENKDNVIAMLMVGNEDVKDYAKEHLKAAFKSMFDDEHLEAYIIEEAEEY
jgi:hypothetical protein